MTDDDHSIEVGKGELNITAHPVTITFTEVNREVEASTTIPEGLKKRIGRFLKINWPALIAALQKSVSELENFEVPEWLVDAWPEVVKIFLMLIGAG
jgi:hypothetical protein